MYKTDIIAMELIENYNALELFIFLCIAEQFFQNEQH